MIKWLLIGLIALGVLLVGALLAVPLLLDSPAMQAYVQQQASHALGRPVKFGGLSIAALPLPSVRLRSPAGPSKKSVARARVRRRRSATSATSASRSCSEGRAVRRTDPIRLLPSRR